MPYKHSGRFTPIGLAIGIAAGLLAGLPLGWGYTALMLVTTYIKLRMLETFGFGVLMGLAVGWALVAAKVRNNMVALTTGAFTGAVAHYIGWCFFIQRMAPTEGEGLVPLDLLTHPAGVFRVMALFNQYGTWTETNSSPTTGVMLWIIWGLEALTVIGMSAVIAWAIVDRKPFCETCNCWAVPDPPQFFQMTLGRDQFKSAIQAADTATLAKVPRATAKNPHFKVELHHCPGCNNLNTVSVAVGGTKQGGSVLPKTLLQPDQADRLRALASASPLARPAGT